MEDLKFFCHHLGRRSYSCTKITFSSKSNDGSRSQKCIYNDCWKNIALWWLEFLPTVTLPPEVLALLLYHHHEYSMLPALKSQSFSGKQVKLLLSIYRKQEACKFWHFFSCGKTEYLCYTGIVS